MEIERTAFIDFIEKDQVNIEYIYVFVFGNSQSHFVGRKQSGYEYENSFSSVYNYIGF